MTPSLDELYETVDQFRRQGGQPDHYREAIELCHRGDAAGDPRFANMLGYFYEHGHGVEKDKSRALQYYERAAALGLPIAKYNCGVMYAERGEQERAIACWREAASMGEVYSMLKLGWAFEEGVGVPQEIAESVRYFQEAAEYGSPCAQEWCGERYAMGVCGVERDLSKGIRMLQQAAAAGRPRAKYVLACLHASGQGVAQDYALAFQLCGEAAEAGERSAQQMRQQMRRDGLGN